MLRRTMMVAGAGALAFSQMLGNTPITVTALIAELGIFFYNLISDFGRS